MPPRPPSWQLAKLVAGLVQAKISLFGIPTAGQLGVR